MQNRSDDLLRSAKKRGDLFDELVRNSYELSHLYIVANHYTPASIFFFSYLQPLLVFGYITICILLLYILLKQKTMGFMQIILIISNSCECIPSLLSIPIIFVFFVMGNVHAPMPYPWCYIYIIFEGPMRLITHCISLYLNMLLSFNRLCALCQPFRMKVWFSKKKKNMYLIMIIGLSIVVSVSITSVFSYSATLSCIDDIWNTGTMEVYTACTINEFSSPEYVNHYLIIRYIELVIIIIPPFIVVIVDIAILYKLNTIQTSRKELYETTPGMAELDKRLNKTNRVFLWILLSFVIIEIPILIIKIITLYTVSNITKFNSQVLDLALFEPISNILYNILTPVDVLLYIMLSSKIRDFIRNTLLTCRNKTPQRNINHTPS